ncbi:hypothetical protein POVCU2_0076880 [Plasmodium ovale curtisi]|uniref:PIR Superfamily Protein n=1 Tax=Plasmodium ovale curtisi TaxID=864141 RepID=A0A1A8X737_PLAOA|nr:hypothetical protein POVCU2_0076880 [Plasmodium ovale curtisi]SBT01057.1 hypothetical protein POVCU1_064310 [Plasmodium ovale curtisi]
MDVVEDNEWEDRLKELQTHQIYNEFGYDVQSIYDKVSKGLTSESPVIVGTDNIAEDFYLNDGILPMGCQGTTVIPLTNDIQTQETANF